MCEIKHFLKLDVSKFFSYWNLLSEGTKAEYRRRFRLMERYQEIKNQIIAIEGNDNLIQIIEKESDDIERRLAFLETTRDELLSGADYSECKTIDDIAKVYSGNLLRRLGFNERRFHE